MPTILFTLLWILSITGVSFAGDWCYDGDLLYCDWGCCDTWPKQTCCSFQTWIIVVSVIGGLVAIGIAIFVICICVIQRRNRRRAAGGQVISGAGTAQPPTVAYGTPYGQPSVQLYTGNNAGFVPAQPAAYPSVQQTYPTTGMNT
ncbi:uncharacterized protein LOC123547294 isoform X2 [Mercenaria mercenaria]|uniref:uncharacterized protein LOC123547294 isoform X2 n=1 Tax=Mercenaria mercenaria TaxID=6596 RepID=UPI001E1DAE3A|nr:uncharacterized protein LOC123547294 isoform X2 [Mercenaria mercenaria]